jgi:putative transposase
MKQMELKGTGGWGGKRKGAGRKNRSGNAAHVKREKVDFRVPLHLTVRLKKDRGNLRTRYLFKALQSAAGRAQDFGLHVNHFSIISNHLHMFVEARNNDALSKGMKSFNGRLGKILSRMTEKRGPVWAARFHMHVLKTPTEVKRALKYILLNYSKHKKLFEHIDDFSSGPVFTQWKELAGKKWNDHFRPLKPEAMGLSPPQSWLARVGWLRAQ